MNEAFEKWWIDNTDSEGASPESLPRRKAFQRVAEEAWEESRKAALIEVRKMGVGLMQSEDCPEYGEGMGTDIIDYVDFINGIEKLEATQ